MYKLPRWSLVGDNTFCYIGVLDDNTIMNLIIYVNSYYGTQ